MADPDQTVVTDDDGPAPVGPTGTLLGEEPMLEPPRRRRPVLPIAAVMLAVIAAVLSWLLVTFEVEAPPPPAIAQRPPPPPPAPAPVHHKVEIPEPVAMPSKPPPPGTVKLFTTPDTHAFVDGQDLGKTPVTLKLPAGRNTVVLENAALPIKRVVTVEVQPNAATEQRFTFSKGWLRVTAPKAARVSVDGQPMSGRREQEVWEGNHRVDIVHADKKGTHETQVAVVAAGEITGVFFEPPTGR